MWFANQMITVRDPTKLSLDTEGEVLGVTAPVLAALQEKSAGWLSLLDAYGSTK